MKTRLVSERDRELIAMPEIASQLPVSFPNGATWTAIRFQCNGCGAFIPDAQVRGTVARFGPDMATVEAVGVCRPCRLLTPFHYRLYGDRLTGLRNGKWQTWPMRRKGWRYWLSRIFRK